MGVYEIGEKVLYGIHGICRVSDMEERTVDRVKRQYLVLEPVGQGSARFLVPSENPRAMAKVKQILSRQELETLLASDGIRNDCWIRDENLRKQNYRELISSADRTRLMAMVHTLYRHRQEQTAAGKKCHLCDENFLRDAEKLLISEISIVLGMDAEQAKLYLREHLE